MQKENPFKAAFDIYKQAYSPFVFQVIRIFYKHELIALNESLSFDQILDKKPFNDYSLKLLLDAAELTGIIKKEEDFYSLSLSGSFLMKDKSARLSFDFMHDICFRGAYYLEESLLNNKPEGLKTISEEETFYKALSTLTETQKNSWFNFDNYHSDIAFEKIINEIDFSCVKRVLDLGGNRGNFARILREKYGQIEITIADLPGQINVAKDCLKDLSGISFLEIDFINDMVEIEGQYDFIMMSQFLDCFSLDEIDNILSLVKKILSTKGQVAVIELFCDRQRMPVAEYMLRMLSLYFTTIANGNSRMYESQQLLSIIQKKGFNVLLDKNNIGIGHSLFLLDKNI